jgi:uncharacterized protein
MAWFVFILGGIGAGLLSGLFGIGGGVLVIPFLTYVMGMGQKAAQGTTLLMLLPPIGILAAWEYWRRGDVDSHAAIWLCVGFLLGSYVGAVGSGVLSAPLLRKGFALLMIGSGIQMFFKR